MRNSAAIPCALSALTLLPSISARVVHKHKDVPAGVPEYVVKYAPVSYLYSGEHCKPASIAGQLTHTTPEVNFTKIDGAPSPLTLDNLDQLNSKGNTSVYLTANDDVTADPSWIFGQQPDANGKVADVSNVVIVNDKGSGNVDAFYMYFYAFDYGGVVLGQNLGNHVGDWEHNMVRFSNGTPTAVWYSQHSNGEAFTYDTVEKSGVRPVNYVANGTHANYAITGKHDHTIPDINLPNGLLVDITDKGALWDSVANAYFYSYNAADQSFTAYDSSSPVGAMNFNGQWGDQQYPDDDPRQSEFFGFYRYTSGPDGPKFKDLNRSDVCPDNGILCIVRTSLGP